MALGLHGFTTSVDLGAWWPLRMHGALWHCSRLPHACAQPCNLGYWRHMGKGGPWAAPIGSDDSEIFKLNNLRQFFHFHLRRGLCDAFWCYLLHHFDTSPAGVLQAGEATHPRTMGSALKGKTRNCPHPMVHTSFLSKVVFIIYTHYSDIYTHRYIYIYMHRY